MGTRRVGVRSQQRVNGLLREQSAGATQVVKQIGIVGMLGQRCLQILDGLLQLPGADLRDPQRGLLVNFLQMGNRFGVVTLRQQRVSQQLMRCRQIRRQFDCMLEGGDGGAVIAIFHVGLAEVNEPVSAVSAPVQ